MDEATSHPNSMTEEGLQAAPRALDRTRLAITQRLGTVCEADLIVVVENGRIMERAPTRNCRRWTVLLPLLTGELSISHRPSRECPPP